MKLNANTALLGEKIALVPYKRHHVTKYNAWMQDVKLQELTASEPLTLEQEYEMQKSWELDERKLTFIILDLQKWNKQKQENSEQTHHSSQDSAFHNMGEGYISLEENCMVGDVNLYCNNNSWLKNVEISVMVAEENCGRRGFGTEAARLIMQYAIRHLHTDTFQAKIGMENTASLKMFEGKLNFKQVEKSEVFQELTLEYVVSRGSATSVQFYTEVNYTAR